MAPRINGVPWIHRAFAGRPQGLTESLFSVKVLSGLLVSLSGFRKLVCEECFGGSGFLSEWHLTSAQPEQRAADF